MEDTAQWRAQCVRRCVSIFGVVACASPPLSANTWCLSGPTCRLLCKYVIVRAMLCCATPCYQTVCRVESCCSVAYCVVLRGAACCVHYDTAGSGMATSLTPRGAPQCWALTRHNYTWVELRTPRHAMYRSTQKWKSAIRVRTICKWMQHDFNASLMYCENFRSFELVVFEIKRKITDRRR